MKLIIKAEITKGYETWKNIFLRIVLLLLL